MIIAHVEGSGTADTVKVRRSLNEVAFSEHPRPVLKSPTREAHLEDRWFPAPVPIPKRSTSP